MKGGRQYQIFTHPVDVDVSASMLKGLTQHAGRKRPQNLPIIIRPKIFCRCVRSQGTWQKTENAMLLQRVSWHAHTFHQTTKYHLAGYHIAYQS